MFSHITVGVSDLDRTERFYDALLTPLGLTRRQVIPDGGPPSRCWHHPAAGFPRFFVYLPFDGQPGSAGNGSMTAFLAPTPEAVEHAHAQGLAHGGTDAGAPGPRHHYAPDYFGAYLRDPDGNKIHIVHRSGVPDGRP